VPSAFDPASLLPRIELRVLLLLAIAAAGAWAFIELADLVREGDSLAFDRAMLLALRDPADPADLLGPGWLEAVGRDITALGGGGVLALITAATAAYLILIGKPHAAVFVVVAVLGGLVLSTVLKIGFARPRPDLVPHAAVVYTPSFPSGHAMLSAATYLTLGALLARMHAQRAVKVFFLGMAVVLTVLVGVSRIYLGVHWPTDVLAGWAAGAVWASVCLLAARWFQRRRVVEKSIDGRNLDP
jgi:undecaprenyl-diphosphatase